jgi:predicted alpha/beta-hydrolase family hydrolase
MDREKRWRVTRQQRPQVQARRIQCQLIEGGHGVGGRVLCFVGCAANVAF